MTANQDPRVRFAETLFGIYPEFLPTQALYLDLEGRSSGPQDILSCYWPVLSGSKRFSWIRRTNSSEIDLASVEAHLEEIGAAGAKWIVVYSAGQLLPDERDRVIGMLGQDPFPDGEWINLLHVVQRCTEMRGSIREHGYAWYERDQTRIRNSLEALEWEFSIKRPVSLRSHSYRYKDLDGGAGSMEVLSTARRSMEGSAEEEEETALRAYCEADVKHMFEIANASEHLVFSRDERRVRRQLYS